MRFLPRCNQIICIVLLSSILLSNMVVDNSIETPPYSKLRGSRKGSQLETVPSPTISTPTAIKLPRFRPRITNTQSDPTLVSTGSPIPRVVTQSQSPTSSATCDKRSNWPSRIVSDSFRHPDQTVDEAARVPQDPIPRKRQRLDGSPGPDVDEQHTSRVSSSSSTPDTKTTRQSRQQHDGPSPVMTPKTARSTHDRLYGELRKNLTPNDQKGIMYVLCDPNNKMRGYKIGMTRRAYRDRTIEHERGCNFTPDVIHVSDHEVEFCGRMEKLVHIDLENYCVPLHCDKHKYADATREIKAHKEWFQVTEEMAVETVKRWERFMQQEKPYGWDRQLKVIWRYLLETRSPVSLGVRTLTDDARREHWEKMLAPPTKTEYLQACRAQIQTLLKSLLHNASYVLMCLSELFWPLSTLIYGTITLAVFQNLLAFGAFVFVLGCASARFLSHVPLSSSKRRSKTPSKVHTGAALMQR